jgi:ParB family chromosome partitioning protein
MAFPPSAYTERGGVGTVKAHARVEAARRTDDEPDPAAPGGAAQGSSDAIASLDSGGGKVLALPAPSPEPKSQPMPLAA